MAIHPNRICKIDDCDKPSVQDGLCPYHYDLKYKKDSLDLLNKILLLLEKSENSKQIQYIPEIIKETIITTKEENKQPNLAKSNFIPSITINNTSAVIKDINTSTTEKNISEIADKINV